MTIDPTSHATTRRRVLRLLALLGIGGSALGRWPASAAPRSAPSEPWPEMTYRTLGKTGFRGSRLVFGCGAALKFRGRRELLDAALARGVNVFDVGTSDYYRFAEANLAAFAREHRERIFLISKGMVGIEVAPDEELSASKRATAARNWSKALDASLADLGTEHLDAYYMMAVNNPSLVASDEMREAFLTAKTAGKVDHWGVSTHQNAEAVLGAMIDVGAYSLVQIAVTPAGWYDWTQKGIAGGSKPMASLRPTLDRARAAGIGLIGMKAARHLTGPWLGFGPDRPKSFDAHYPKKLLGAPLSPFQRSYAFVLSHGLDAVNADSQSLEHLRENHLAAATAERYFV